MSAVAVGALVLPSAPPRVWTAVALCAILPDLDAIGRPFGRGDLALLGGHRALTHSLTAAAVLSLGAAYFLRRRSGASITLVPLWAGLFVATASHAVLDAFMRYGEGIAFLAPWSWARYRAPSPVLSGLASDLALFLTAAVVARVAIQLRGWPVPRALAWGRRASVV
jgi:membrane-bound metal-dependent hydrolase YbcI (DUF457 family)